jgi:hypothetical protein
MALCELMKEGHCSGEAARAGLSSHAWLASRWHCMNEHTGYRLYLIYASIYIGVSFAGLVGFPAGAQWFVAARHPQELHVLMSISFIVRKKLKSLVFGSSWPYSIVKLSCAILDWADVVSATIKMEGPHTHTHHHILSILSFNRKCWQNKNTRK